MRQTQAEFLLRAIAECFARLSYRLGVSKRRHLESQNFHGGLPPRTRVYSYNISCYWMRGFLSNEGVK